MLECLEERLAPSVSFHLFVPSSSSYGVNNALTIQYANAGTTSVPAPVVLLSATNADVWLPTDPAVDGTSLQVLVTGPTGSAGILAPGANGDIVVDFTATSSTASEVNFSLSQFTPGQIINWSAQESSMQPSTIPTAAWPAVFANFTANVGSTTTSYQAALDADATYLAQLGEPTDDVARLVAYEINKANDAYSTSALDDNVDASLSMPGSLSLSFDRWFQPEVSSRYLKGTLGLGWTNNWDLTASTDSNGNVTINESGDFRYFTLQSDGSYLGTSGDDGVLTKLSGGGYQLTETDGSSTVFNANGTLDYVQDSNGNRIAATYDSNGLLSRLTASNGEYLTLSYTSGLLTKLTDSTGKVSTYTYDPTGQYLLSNSDEYGQTTYTYVTGQGAASQNALASITDADNSAEYFSYDVEGRLIDEHQNNNQENATISYGSAGGFTTTDADSKTSTVLMDDYGQVSETIDARGNVTHYGYDASGDLTAVHAPQGSSYSFTYDRKGNLLSETDPLGLTTQFTYNSNNDLTSYTDPKSNTTSYAYDSKNDLLSVTYANGTEEQYSYNPLGEATQFVNANGEAINSTYNTQGLVTEETFANGSSYAYTYDVHGNILTATSTSGTIRFEYQNSATPDLLTEVEYPNGQYLKFSYNAIGQRTQSVDQAGFTINYGYDSLGRLQKLTDVNGNLIVQYTYDAAGNLIQQDNGNGTFTVYTYDGDTDVLSITNYAPSTGTVSDVPAKSKVNSFDIYTYDELGNVLTDTNQDGKWVYSYDADSQLIHAVFTPNKIDPDGLTSQNLKYVYDAAGNRISETVNGVITTYTANNVNEYTSSATNGVTTTYQYDKDGNLTSQTTGSSTTTFSYDELDELTGMNAPGLTSTYTNDPLGNRDSETINGITTQFLIDPMSGVASAYTGSGSLIAHFISGFGLVSQVSASGSAAYYDFNRSGSSVGITGSNGSYVNKYSYLPFGQTTTITAALTNSFTFVGQFGVMQDGAAMFRMRAREYSSNTGQFLSNDPLGLGGGDTNVRRYVGNSPVVMVDPRGLSDFQNAMDEINQGIKANEQQAFKEVTTPKWQAQLDQPAQTFESPSALQEAEWQGEALAELETEGVPLEAAAEGTAAAGAGGTFLAAVGAFFAGFFVGQKLVEANPGLGKLYELIPDDFYDAIVNGTLPHFGAPSFTGQTASSQPSDNSDGGPIEGTPATVEVGEWEGSGTPTATTVFNELGYSGDTDNTVTTTDTFQEQSPENYEIYATVTFPEADEYGVTTTVNGNDVVEDPDHEAIIVYDAPIIVTPVDFTIPASGIYHGPVATFQDLNPEGNISQYGAWTSTDGTINGPGDVPATIEGGAGSGYTVIADIDFRSFLASGERSISFYASVWDTETPWNPQGGGDVVDTATLTSPGHPQYSTSVYGQVLQTNANQPADPPLAIIDTTDSTITSARQVIVSVGTPTTSTAPIPLVTGITLTQLPNGVKQIVVNGVVSAVQPGAGRVVSAPLNIKIGNEPRLTSQVVVDESMSDYLVNPTTVTAVAGQPLEDVQVATLYGPVTGPYSGTVTWGDGETSPAQFTALGSNLFSVTASKPEPYAASGSYTVTVTVNGPGDTPAPAAISTANVAKPIAPTVRSISPAFGSTAGGAWVTITGTNLAGVTEVKFGALAAASIVSATATQIVAVSPARAAGGVNITVVTASGTSAISTADRFTYVVAPRVSLSTANLAADAAILVIHGSGFSSIAANNAVIFANGATAEVISATATTLTVKGLKGLSLGNLLAIVASNTVSSISLVQVATVIPVVTPSAASLGVNATSLTINGFGFDPTAANDVISLSDGATIPATSATANQLIVDDIGALKLGSLTASVEVDDESSGKPVQVASVKPVVTAVTSSLDANGTTWTIQGFGFSAVASGDTVAFSGGVKGKVIQATPTQLTLSQLTGLVAGSLSALVTVSGVTSVRVQVATIVPVVEAGSIVIAPNATSLVVHGYGFSNIAIDDKVMFADGATGVVTSATGTTLVVKDLKGLIAGPLSVTVTINDVSNGFDVDLGTVS